MSSLTTVNPAVVSLEASDRVLLPQFVKAAHEHNVKASLSIGGWTGSRWFSSNVGSTQNRSAFAKAVTGLVKEYKLDGIGLDCAPSNSQHGSASSALAAWTTVGMPKDHIVLGVPMYGHSYRVRRDVAYADQSKTSLALYPPYDINDEPSGDRWNGNGGLDICGVYEPPAGTYAFWSLIDAGFLNADGSAKEGITYRYDACSQTPYVYNSTSEIMIAYDDPQSFSAKGNFIKSNGLRGFAAWESAGDYNDLLVNAIRESVFVATPNSSF
ncbi:hypothetical protein C0995_015543 [Termitomyces sp. Mi166|nr:hypothetical protein C0995_015543 [Termitomyces sp. Mi166\